MRLIDADKLSELSYGAFVDKMLHGNSDYSTENVISVVDDFMKKQHINLNPVALEELHKIIQTGGKSYGSQGSKADTSH